MKRLWLSLLLLGCGGIGSSALFGDGGKKDAVAEEQDGGVAMDDGSVGPDAGKKDSATIDSPINPPSCQSVCPMNGGTCVNGVCVIDCGFGPNGCPTKVVCPKGVPCKVLCGGTSSCGQGVDCTQASSCEISCGGISSCGGKVSCAGTTCSVNCSGISSCFGGVCCTAKTCNVMGVMNGC